MLLKTASAPPPPVFRYAEWDDPQVPNPRPDFPPPTRGRWAWFSSMKDGLGNPIWESIWQWGDERGQWGFSSDGLLATGATPSGCDWPPDGWPVEVERYPIGDSPAHIRVWTSWGWKRVSWGPWSDPEEDPMRDIRAIVRATRMLAVHLGRLHRSHLQDRLPETREEASLEMQRLTTAILDQEDGPVVPNHFRWRGAVREFPSDQRRLYRFLVAVWPAFRLRGLLHINDLNVEYQAAGGRELGIETAEYYCRQLSDLLASLSNGRFPARVRRQGEHVRWVDTGT